MIDSRRNEGRLFRAGVPVRRGRTSSEHEGTDRRRWGSGGSADGLAGIASAHVAGQRCARHRRSVARPKESGKSTLAGVFGVKLPVRDLTAARAWYKRLFDLRPIFQFPDDDGVVRGVADRIAGLDTGLALRERPDVAGISGFDPVIFAVADRDAIDAWSCHLDALGIEHQVALATIGWIIVFRDPDGPEIHLYSRERHGRDMTGAPGRGRAVIAA